ncbi:uncharacterized protein LOC120255401 [Dioscorea cayenensis subsp. rotundata]|uniref:Uncharacterized protein LOC120255401 n=1 Tax=Dioscorea cayennensis subsp. rotundata TaxID=55577 RepID=A0AB40AW54_DIOCR|nr:uncharacterized protein LOC120255401 [Dioscorea cayenensis subsp. rotundata]
METFSAVARYKGEGHVLQFTVLSSWESVMGEICARWAVDVSQVKVKFVTPDAYKTLCPINSDADFQRMCHIYHSFNKFVMDIIIEDVSVSADGNLAYLIPLESLSDNVNPNGDSFLSQHNSSGACKNDKLRVTVRCAAQEWQWRVHAFKEGIHCVFRLKTMQATHICGERIGTTVHPKASKKWVSERVMQKLKETPLYKAVDIQKDILRDHGVCFPYKPAWMGKEVARSAIHSSELIAMICFNAKYGGKDDNDGLFHVAFAIVDNETNENWTWFLATLGDALYGEDTYDKIITFISDRSKGLVHAVARVFPSSPHGYCLRHLEANFMKTNSSLVRELACLSADAQAWLMNKSDVDHWSNYSFKGMRWCEMYLNVAESFNAWIKEARHLPVTSMVNSIRFKLMNIVGHSTDDTYEVIDNNNNAVSLQSHSCSCRRWEIHGLPCKHACVAIMQTDTNVHSYVADYFTVEWYHRAYANPISPVPDSDKPPDDNCPLRLRQPISKKQLGRSRKKRIESQAFDVRELHYSQCHEVGHNWRSCNAVIAD